MPDDSLSFSVEERDAVSQMILSVRRLGAGV